VGQLKAQQDASGEWIEVPVILHGLSWSNAAHTFVQMHSITLELRASLMTRDIKGEYYEFAGKPKPVLGAPKWQHIEGRRDLLLLLVQVYRWT